MDCKRIPGSASSQWIREHDVFLSFCGEDTRYNFTDHLFAALQRKGIFTFRDDVKVQKGEAISLQLLNAIERSRIFIVVFSKNYAQSTWCLEELAKIADCIEFSTKNPTMSNASRSQTVFPIFYEVDPSEVRKQIGGYEKSFTNLENTFKENLEKVCRWRTAMTKVANISGWHVKKKSELEVIDGVVQHAISILGHKCSTPVDDLVGIQSRAKAIESLLFLGSKDDVRVVGICGMGGIGKTTLASVVSHKISHQFDACSFLADVSEVSNCERHGLVRLQKQLLFQTLKDKEVNIWDPYCGARLLSTRLGHLKSLIILDDVDDENQLENLVGERGWFGAGSRILITSRNEHILRQYGVDEVYNVNLLNDHEALKLLCRRAFKKDKPLRNYEKLTLSVLKYVQGLPLAIKVLGSFLSTRDVSEWASFLNKMQESPEPKIMNVLRTSVDRLEEYQREIFLDIACFFNGKEEGYVKHILECCGFHPEIGINDLVDRSLLTIFQGKYIRMHDLLQELGKRIVREEYPNEPEKWSRLWLYKDFEQVMTRNKETDHVEAIVLELEDREKTPLLRAEALSKISRLRMLIFCNVNVSGSLNCLSNKLKYVSWPGYPFAYLPSNFQSPRNSKQLWKGQKALVPSQPFHSLVCMNLRHSQNLIETPNFSWLPNLEVLDLEGCTKLSHIHPSIGLLHNLYVLSLKHCKSLVCLPNNLSTATSLEELYLTGCSKIKRTPDFRGLPNLVALSLKSCTSLSEVDESIGALTKLAYLNLTNCKNLVLIPPSMFVLSSLKSLSMTGCSKLLNQSENARPAKGHDISETGQSILCILRKSCNPVGLSLASLFALAPSLKKLDLSYCNLCEVPNSIGRLQYLEALQLDGNDFTTLPCTIKNLQRLRYFCVQYCKNLEYLPELASSLPDFLLKRRYCRDVPTMLSMFNCPKLAEMNGSCQRLALSWLRRSIQDPIVPKVDTFFYNVVPGSEIPRPFKHGSSTSSVTIRVPPNVRDRDKNWLGLTLCVTFVAHDPHPPIDDFGRMESTLRCHLYKASGICICLHAVKREITVELDHLLVLHILPHDKSLIQMIEEADFIDVEFTAGPGFEIKKCGFLWMYI